jgi:hypothetical protein
MIQVDEINRCVKGDAKAKDINKVGLVKASLPQDVEVFKDKHLSQLLGIKWLH